jgi:hypothetical protein
MNFNELILKVHNLKLDLGLDFKLNKKNCLLGESQLI